MRAAVNRYQHSRGTGAGRGVGHVDRPFTVPVSVTDETGTAWQILRAWPYRTPGDFTLEVAATGRPGVRGALLRQGSFGLVPPDDPRLPALQSEARHGVLLRYMPYKRAVIRAEGRYIKIFRPGREAVPAERCAQVDMLVDTGTFLTPRVLRRSPAGVIEFSSIPGPTLNELGGEDPTAGDDRFVRAWQKWSRAWADQLNSPPGTARLEVLNNLPLRSAEVQAADAWRRVDRWLRHTADVPGASSRRRVLLARAELVAASLLGTRQDRLVWAHGDLHDKQIIATAGASPPGLLDFDGMARAEAAMDLANLDVHLELHFRQGSLAPARYLAAHGEVLAAAEELHVSPGRFRAYSDALWLRLASSPLPGRMSLALSVLAERADHPGAASLMT